MATKYNPTLHKELVDGARAMFKAKYYEDLSSPDFMVWEAIDGKRDASEEAASLRNLNDGERLMQETHIECLAKDLRDDCKARHGVDLILTDRLLHDLHDLWASDGRRRPLIVAPMEPLIDSLVEIDAVMKQLLEFSPK